jgi:hypothetical protein
VDRTGIKAWTWTRAGVMAAVLVLGVVGCGGDDDGSTGSGSPTETDGDQGDDPGQAAGGAGGDSSDLCSLLTTGEVEAQFGEVGAVADPHMEYGSCVWEIGEQGDDGTGDLISLYRFVGDPSRSFAENWGADLAGDQPVEGVGDEAWVSEDGTSVMFNRGDQYLSLSSAFGSVLGSDVPGVREKMIALAELVASRA